MNIDLSGITYAQFAIVLIVVMAVDFATGVVGALASGTFDPSKVADVVTSHLVPRVFPIGALALLAFALPAAQGAHDVLWTASVGLLAAYVVETVASVTANVHVAKPAA